MPEIGTKIHYMAVFMKLIQNDMNDLVEFLSAVDCPQKIQRMRQQLERLQQLRKFPEVRNLKDMVQRQHAA